MSDDGSDVTMGAVGGGGGGGVSHNVEAVEYHFVIDDYLMKMS